MIKFTFRNYFLIFCFIFNGLHVQAADYYWVGGTGNWSDYGNHWAASSGGLIFHTTIPGPFDDVYFDSNSFLFASDSLLLDISILYCRNMDWTGTSNIPFVYDITGNSFFSIYGSLLLIPGFNYFPAVKFESINQGNTITSAGAYLAGIEFNGSGSWTLNDSLNTGSIEMSNGSLSTNNQAITCYSIRCNLPNVISLQLGTSVVKIAHDCFLNLPLLNLSAFSSTIYCNIFNSGKNQVFHDLIVDQLTADSILVDNLIVQNGNISNSTVQYAEINSGLTINNSIINQVVINGISGIDGFNNFMQKVTCTNDVNILGSHTMDTLIFNNPGNTVMLDGFLFINNALWINASPGFPIIIQNNVPQNFPMISSQSGNTICFDYVYLKNINATGGATFYAGDHSLNLGGNTGWTWFSCTPDTSNVWPGDANYDLVADNIDLLYIGLAYGYTGPARTGASNSWVAQPGIDWQQQFATGYNLKHADCDGNGTVNASDTLAVSLNYGLTHPYKQPAVPQVSGFGPDLYFEWPSASLVPGSVVDIPIKFGNSGNPVQHIYGIAFTVNYDPALLQPNETEIHVDNSWLGDSNNSIFLSRDFHTNGYIDLGFTRIDHQDVTGYGTLATLRFKVAANAGGYLNLGFSDVVVIDKHELPQPVSLINGSVYAGMYEHGTAQEYTVSPNPTGDNLHIHNLYGGEARYRLLDITGNEVIPEKSFSGHAILDVSGLTDGLYLLLLRSPGGVITRKISVISAGKW